MIWIRRLLGLSGLLVGTYGAWLLVSRQSFDQLVSVAEWLAAGVLLHDGLLSGLLVLLGVAGARLPRAVGVAATTIVVVLGSITIVAIPALIHSRSPQANATLLPRDYPVGWVVTALLVLVGAAAAGWCATRRARRKG